MFSFFILFSGRSLWTVPKSSPSLSVAFTRSTFVQFLPSFTDKPNSAYGRTLHCKTILHLTFHFHILRLKTESPNSTRFYTHVCGLQYNQSYKVSLFLPIGPLLGQWAMISDFAKERDYTLTVLKYNFTVSLCQICTCSYFKWPQCVRCKQICENCIDFEWFRLKILSSLWLPHPSKLQTAQQCNCLYLHLPCP